MTVNRNPKNFAADIARRLAKRQPRTRRPKNPGESKTRRIVWARSDRWCEVCGIAVADSIHHRWKKGQGGPWSPSNCIAVCGDGTRGCHGWIEHNPNAAAAQGLHLRPGEIPAEVPIASGMYDRVLLGDDGSVTPIEGAAS